MVKTTKNSKGYFKAIAIFVIALMSVGATVFAQVEATEGSGGETTENSLLGPCDDVHCRDYCVDNPNYHCILTRPGICRTVCQYMKPWGY